MGFGKGALLWLLGIPLPIIILLCSFYASLTIARWNWGPADGASIRRGGKSSSNSKSTDPRLGVLELLVASIGRRPSAARSSSIEAVRKI